MELIDDLFILHRKSKSVFAAASESVEWLEWQTCIRKLAIGRADNLEGIKQAGDDEIYTGADAYQFCMEVICGLHSPMPGETEVFGQFKQLVERYEECPYYDVEIKKLLLNLIADAKVVRQQYLTGLGSNSYGSLVRRKVKDLEEVNLLGAGLLVKDILPWLNKLGIRVRVHCRNIKKGRAMQKEYPTIFVEDIAGTRKQPMVGALVVAAPLTADAISQWMRAGRDDLSIIMDLRGDSHIDPILAKCDVESLSHLFQEMERTRELVEQKMTGAKSMINRLIIKKQNVMQIRPHGWFDIC